MWDAPSPTLGLSTFLRDLIEQIFDDISHKFRSLQNPQRASKTDGFNFYFEVDDLDLI